MVICDHKHVNDQKWYSVGEEFVVQLCFIYPKKERKKVYSLTLGKFPSGFWGFLLIVMSLRICVCLFAILELNLMAADIKIKTFCTHYYNDLGLEEYM